MATETIEEQAERLRSAFVQAIGDWNEEPSNDNLRKKARNRYQLYVGFCVKNNLDFIKVSPF